MAFLEKFKSTLSNLAPDQFEEAALALFRWQSEENLIYRKYISNLGCQPQQVTSISEIPFLPIDFFKEHQVVSHLFTPEVIFKSSGTTQQSRSQHLVADVNYYKQHAQRLFEEAYGPLAGCVVLALLPSYVAQGDSSLVMMVDHFTQMTGQTQPGFCLNNHAELRAALREALASGKKTYLFGVTYALLDFAEEEAQESGENLVIFETGGMKGRRREMVREELHGILKKAFGGKDIHSEYGMTELLSQAYSPGDGIFWPSRTLRVLVREVNDPLAVTIGPGSGGLNVIDLANVDSCAFIETKDLGKIHADGSFEVLGRFDNADIRGCNLLVS